MQGKMHNNFTEQHVLTDIEKVEGMCAHPLGTQDCESSCL